MLRALPALGANAIRAPKEEAHHDLAHAWAHREDIDAQPGHQQRQRPKDEHAEHIRPAVRALADRAGHERGENANRPHGEVRQRAEKDACARSDAPLVGREAEEERGPQQPLKHHHHGHPPEIAAARLVVKHVRQLMPDEDDAHAVHHGQAPTAGPRDVDVLGRRPAEGGSGHPSADQHADGLLDLGPLVRVLDLCQDSLPVGLHGGPCVLQPARVTSAQLPRLDARNAVPPSVRLPRSEEAACQ
mmetsp:Transcript_74994/g.229467  ORF Transcript_74994/g.229467 Transcript_74994/m.229467 type:complete len:245 (+) Transcript_74994:133-867(+)